MKMKMKIRKYLQDTTKILLRYLQRHSYRRPRHQEYHLPNLSRCVCFLLLSWLPNISQLSPVSMTIVLAKPPKDFSSSQSMRALDMSSASSTIAAYDLYKKLALSGFKSCGFNNNRTCRTEKNILATQPPVPGSQAPSSPLRWASRCDCVPGMAVNNNTQLWVPSAMQFLLPRKCKPRFPAISVTT